MWCELLGKLFSDLLRYRIRKTLFSLELKAKTKEIKQKINISYIKDKISLFWLDLFWFASIWKEIFETSIFVF